MAVLHGLISIRVSLDTEQASEQSGDLIGDDLSAIPVDLGKRTDCAKHSPDCVALLTSW